MDEHEAMRLVALLRRERPGLRPQTCYNDTTQAYEVDITGGDPRGIRVWLTSPRAVMRYIAWLRRRAS